MMKKKITASLLLYLVFLSPTIFAESVLDGQEPSAGEEPSTNKEPSAGKEPSANQEPSAGEEPLAGKELSADEKPSANKAKPSQPPAQTVYTPYSDEPKALFEFFFDEPGKIYSALFWLRSYMNTLVAEPYGVAPEFMHIIVLIHGTEIVTLAKKNYAKYKNAVDRMDYYQQLGVEFRVCMAAAHDYGYNPEDFQPFVKLVPSAMVELGHWQSKGYPLIRPLVFEKRFNIEEIR